MKKNPSEGENVENCAGKCGERVRAIRVEGNMILFKFDLPPAPAQ